MIEEWESLSTRVRGQWWYVEAEKRRLEMVRVLKEGKRVKTKYKLVYYHMLRKALQMDGGWSELPEFVEVDDRIE